MKIKEVMHQKVAELEVHGKLMGPPETLAMVDEVKNLIKDGVSRIVLNLKHVNWINSLGLGAIVKCIKVVQEAQGMLQLSGLTEKVHSLFVMSQLIQIVTIHDSVEEAITELNAS